MGLRTWLGFRKKLPHRGVKRELPTNLGSGVFRLKCSVGAYTYINGESRFYAADVGRFCSIAHQVIVGAPEHPTDRLSTHTFAYHHASRFPGDDEEIVADETWSSPRTTIGNDVWLGAYSYIRSGVSIGHGAIVGAHAVVTKDVPPYAIVAGSPARILRYRFDPETIRRLLDLQWWNFVPERKIVGRWDRPIDEILSAFETTDLRPLVPKVEGA